MYIAEICSQKEKKTIAICDQIFSIYSNKMVHILFDFNTFNSFRSTVTVKQFQVGLFFWMTHNRAVIEYS